MSASNSPLQFALAGWCVASCCAASISPCAPPHSLVLLPRNLHLSLFQGVAGFIEAAASCPLVPPADSHNPLIALLPLLILSTIHRLLSANASPPVGPLFASWLSCHPCCCATAASRPLDTLPPPLVLLTRHLCLEMSSHHLSAGASPLVCLPFAGWFSHIILSCRRLKYPSLTPAFIHTGWLLHLISSRCFHLPSSCQHCHLLMRWQLTSRLPLVCPNWLPVCLTWYAQ